MNFFLSILYVTEFANKPQFLYANISQTHIKKFCITGHKQHSKDKYFLCLHFHLNFHHLIMRGIAKTFFLFNQKVLNIFIWSHFVGFSAERMVGLCALRVFIKYFYWHAFALNKDMLGGIFYFLTFSFSSVITEDWRVGRLVMRARDDLRLSTIVKETRVSSQKCNVNVWQEKRLMMGNLRTTREEFCAKDWGKL